MLLAVGCGERKTQFQIVNYPVGGGAERFHQGFDECYYWFDGNQNLEVVARRTSQTDEGVPTTQAIHVRTFWLPRPGVTYAEPTMINATVSYMILVGPDGATFGGSGFFSFKEKRDKTSLVGRLELSSLTPQRRVGEGDKLFERATLEGEMVGVRDRKAGTMLANEMHRVFGPMPDYQRKPDNPDLY